jgi:hypothetical protein
MESEMKKTLLALAVTPVLCLFSSVTFADVSGIPNATGNGIVPTFGEIKNAKACGDATFFKNKFPSLTNGTPGGTDFIDFTVDGKIVRVDIEWYPDNSFEFTVTGGYASRVGVTVDTNNFIYDYTDLVDGIADTRLNYYGVGLTADDVNHLDLCLETLDSDPPEVGIRVEPSSDGTTVAGTISIIATVTDESPVNVTIETVSADGSLTITACDPLDPLTTCADGDLLGPTVSGDEYTWTWDTTTVPPGEYTITVTATDISALANVTTESLTVTVSVLNCLEGADGIPDDQIGVGGCNPSGFQIVELPNELDGLLDDKTITQLAVPALLSAQTETCGIDPNTGDRYEFVAQDPRVNPDGSIIGNSYRLDLSTVFDLSGIDLSIYAPNGVFLRADTVGSPCLTLIFGDANFSFADFYEPSTGAPLQGTGAYNYAVTQLPEEVPGMFTLPEVGDLQPDPGLAGFQPDLQFVPQATYQDDLLTLIEQAASPFTSDVINPQRKLTPEFSWFLLNTREVCLFLDPDLPDLEAVLQCKIDLAIEYFDNLEQAVIEAGPNLLDPSVNNLLTDVNKARSMVKVRFWDKAITDLTSLENQVVNGLWIVDEPNDPGNLIMRIKNLFFRIEQLALAESALP